MTSAQVEPTPALDVSAALPGQKTNRRRWAALPIILAGTIMVTLDFFIVNVAIPSLQTQLHATSGEVQFVVAGYGLAYAAGMITAGRLGDLYGRRRLFTLGLALFTLSSAACGLAPTAATLVIARVVQGLAAAVLGPQGLAMLGVNYTGEDRARAFTMYGLALGLAAVCGQLIGGLLIAVDVAGLDWRVCFFINVPIGIAAVVLAPRLLPESRAASLARLDLAGGALVTLGVLAIVLPLIEGRELGWPLWTWLCLAAALPLLLAFIAYQRRLGVRGGAPLVDLALFGERAFAIGLLAVLAFFAGMASYFLVLALYLQEGRGLSALASGAIFTILGFGYSAASLYAPRLARRLGRQVLAAGALTMAAGLIVLAVTVTRIGMDGPILLLAPGLLLDGIGMGLALAPLISIVLADLPARHAGAAAGILTTMQQMANALGVAFIGLIFYGILGPSMSRDAYPQALSAALLYLVALAVAVAVLIQLLPRGQKRR